MVILERNEPGKLILLLNGEFNFADHDVFRSVIAKIATKAAPIISLDMTDLLAVDSAGIGMLIIGFDKAKEFGITLVIENANEDILLRCKLYGLDTARQQIGS